MNKMGSEKKCSLCENSDDYDHKNSITHRFNFMLFQWSKCRKKIVQDRHDVAVSVKLVDFVNGTRLKYKEDKDKGSCITQATVAQAKIQNANGINFLFTVRNVHPTENVILVKTCLLHPDSSFKLLQVVGAEDLNDLKELLPGATYSFKVRYLPRQISVGSFTMPAMMNFQTRKNETFSLGREIVIIISDEEELDSNESFKKSPFTSQIWEDQVKTWHDAKAIFRRIPDYYPIPRNYYNILKFGLTDYRGMANNEYAILDELREKLAPNYPTIYNYKNFFHIVLWLDEIGAELMLKRYNMEGVKMTRIPGDFLELEVPGLAEKRPSLIKGDYVNMRLCGDRTGYKGIIQIVKDKSIWITGVHSHLTEHIQDHPYEELDVSFQLGRLNYERMHAAIDKCVSNGMVQSLFPDPKFGLAGNTGPYNIPEYFNVNVTNNEEQKRAVLNILNCKSGRAPYIVFGPPGTGKTVTIVEAILQIKKLTTKRILICAPANAACDWIAEKLVNSKQCTKKELLRMHSCSRDWDAVPEIVQPYSNYSDGDFFQVTDDVLLKYRIVISTLINIGRFFFKQVYHPDFVFIDEAAQAFETEAVVPIALLLPGKQVILAGDPKQLGPTCSSAVAEKYNLGVSLLERLMKLPMYQNENPNFITMLKMNFRSHPDILQLPNNLFYDKQLKAVSEYALSDPVANIFIYPKIINIRHEHPGQPVEFCSVLAKERREGNSPSYFNEKEIEMVIKYVKMLLNLTETKVSPDDIGIVTPYIRQVYRINDKLKQYGYVDVKVGTPESFQGREKRIVIVSTVRAQDCLLLYDKRYKLGFVKNEKRFNVALTRAISKLIVIGCPNVLRYDKKCWMEYIEFCEDRYSYFGGKMDRRNETLKRDVIGRMQNVEAIEGERKK